MTDIAMDRDNTLLCVTLGVKLTASEVPELQAGLKRELGAGCREVLFDFRQTATLDSTGIGLLVAANNSLLAVQGSVRLMNVSADIMKLLQSMRLAARLNATGI